MMNKMKTILSMHYCLAFLLSTAAADSLSTSSTALAQAEVEDRKLQTQTCPSSICGDAVMGTPEMTIPVIEGGNVTCAQVDDLLAASNPDACDIVAQFAPFVSIAAWCGCEGVSVPNVCTVCAEGGEVLDETAVFSLLGTTLTCGDGEDLIPYLSATAACAAFAGAFDDPCCVPVDAVTPSPSTMMPVDVSTTPTPVAETATPASAGPSDMTSSAPSSVPSSTSSAPAGAPAGAAPVEPEESGAAATTTTTTTGRIVLSVLLTTTVAVLMMTGVVGSVGGFGLGLSSL